ncbi:MAG: phosphoribosylamine--glycine ligase [Candidatus Susulua stagnicola]|nr:phosphoribosylamine--glycine ligase [Candidatus Susulua stagnicola]
MKVLVIGSGGREHCLCLKLSQSPLVEKIYCAPGNGGTSLVAENVNILATDIEQLLKFAIDKKIDLTVVGPEDPLVAGIVDEFEAKGLRIFGPRRDLALLEGSKAFAKEVMRKYNIPTADFRIFENPDLAKKYLKKRSAPVVIKADGLAAGKGVVVAGDINEAIAAVDMMMVGKKLASAGEKIIIEDCLEGEEVSILVITDGDTVIPLVSSQDHKPVYDNDKGPNSGGMGAYAPAPILNQELLKRINDQIAVPLIQGFKKEGTPYTGILYIGLMIKNNLPFVLEFNVRFGDPETQVILPKLKSDLADLISKTVDNKLSEVKLEWDERVCLCVVLASGGYPVTYEKGKEIKGLESLAESDDFFVFHAGTKLLGDKPGSGFITNGGRVLNITAFGQNIREAQDRAYKIIENISFEKMHFRRDIGNKALNH